MKIIKFIDLFCGAGGLSEGLTKAGMKAVYATDIDEQAIETFKFNHKDVTAEKTDIRNITGDRILELTKSKRGDIELVVGGPPCQGFSLAGLRIPESPKNKLVLEYLRVIREIEPRAFLFENVPGIMSMQNGAVVNALRYAFEELGYKVNYKILNPMDFGVPQSRPRFILIGSKEGDFSFPDPTHFNPNNIKQPDLFGKPLLSPYITVEEALSDLPYIEQGQGSEELGYSSDYKNEYQKNRRGNRFVGKIFNHRATKHSEKIITRYSMIPQGATNGAIPEEFRTKKNNVFKLSLNKPSRTVTCNFRTDLLHPLIPRGLTVREAARLQSFDDDYKFFGNLTRKAKWVTQDDQVGNAVPPLFVEAIGKNIIKFLEK